MKSTFAFVLLTSTIATAAPLLQQQRNIPTAFADTIPITSKTATTKPIITPVPSPLIRTLPSNCIKICSVTTGECVLSCKSSARLEQLNDELDDELDAIIADLNLQNDEEFITDDYDLGLFDNELDLEPLAMTFKSFDPIQPFEPLKPFDPLPFDGTATTTTQQSQSSHQKQSGSNNYSRSSSSTSNGITTTTNIVGANGIETTIITISGAPVATTTAPEGCSKTCSGSSCVIQCIKTRSL